MKLKEIELVPIMLLALSVMTSCDKDDENTETTLEQAYESLQGKRFVYDDLEVVSMPSQEYLDEKDMILEQGYYISDGRYGPIGDTVWVHNAVADNGDTIHYADMPQINVDFKGYLDINIKYDDVFKATMCPFNLYFKSRDTLTMGIYDYVWLGGEDAPSFKLFTFDFAYTLDKQDNNEYAILIESENISELPKDGNEEALKINGTYNGIGTDYINPFIDGNRLLKTPYTPIVYSYASKSIAYDHEMLIPFRIKDENTHSRFRTKLKH